MAKKNELSQKFIEQDYQAITKQVKSKSPILKFFLGISLAVVFGYITAVIFRPIG